jgi:uncharacterized linocin/CFP29 family protein
LVAAIVGVVCTLLGVALGHILGAFRAHTQWLGEQKRLEYRELLDRLYLTVSVVTESRRNPSKVDWEAINDAAQKLSCVFEDRLFVARRLRESGANDDWIAMKKLIYDGNRPVNPFQPFARASRRLYSVTSAHNRDGRILMGE